MDIELIPKTIGNFDVLLSAMIDDTCKHTNNCTHEINGKVLGKANWAAITKPEKTGECYLFMCYEDNQLTDSAHESIEDAKEQAEWEYEGISNVWKDAT